MEPKEMNDLQGCNSTLVLGGTRSGKSAYAESLLQNWINKKIYIATAEARDAEMILRINKHRELRGNKWETIESPLDLVPTLQRHASNDTALLVDCLTLWLSNLIHAGRDIEKECQKLADYLNQSSTRIVMVSSEVGLGIVPENALARLFRDHAGKLNQLIANVADNVFFISAGLPISLKVT